MNIVQKPSAGIKEVGLLFKTHGKRRKVKKKIERKKWRCCGKSELGLNPWWLTVAYRRQW